MKKSFWGNPYTHEEHSKTTWAREDIRKDETCDWCGNRNRWDGLFSYDGDTHKFCSKGCARAYHN